MKQLFQQTAQKTFLGAVLKTFCFFGLLLALSITAEPLAANKAKDFFNKIGDGFKDFGHMTKDALKKAQHQIDHSLKDAMSKVKKGIKTAAYKTGDIAKHAAKGVKVAAEKTAKGIKKAAVYTYDHRSDIGHGISTGWDKINEVTDSSAFQAGLQIAEIGAPMVAG